MQALASKTTAYVPAGGLPMHGRLAVFDEHLVFYDQDGIPLITIPRDTIYAVVSERRLLRGRRMRIRTVNGDFTFNDGYRELHDLLAGPAAATAAF